MIRLTISTPDTRITEIFDENLSPKEVLTSKSINISTASLILDGQMLTAESQRKSFKDLGATGDVTLAVCVKLANA